jgi:signal transduction histidine kinase
VRAIRKWKSQDERQQYLRLKRNVLRVLPYAIYAQKRYEQLDRELALANSAREERRLIKLCEDEIKEKINSEVKNLSVSQGKILIKLIERQTGQTSYKLVRDMKGGVSAFVYQGVARMFGHNLKASYDPEEDFVIENIIREYETVRPMNKPYQ